jgi:hypothetical protein
VLQRRPSRVLGRYGMKPMTEAPIAVSRAVAENLGVQFELTWSLRARGSNGPSAIFFREISGT